MNHKPSCLPFPNRFDQVLFGTVQQAYDLGALPLAQPSISAPIKAPARSSKSARPSRTAHQLGMATVLWCYLRNKRFKKDKDYHLSADLTGQPIISA